MAYKWYFLRCQSGREKRIRDNAIHRIKIAGVEDVVPQVLMPFKIIQDMKRGKKRTVEEKLYPGYLMVQADLEGGDESQINKARTTLRGIDGLRDFLGTGGEPTAISEAEVTEILSLMTDSETRPQVTIGLTKGEQVKINTGPFDGFDGTVEEVNADKGTVRVVVTIFGRPTPVDLKYWEVDSVA